MELCAVVFVINLTGRVLLGKEELQIVESPKTLPGLTGTEVFTDVFKMKSRHDERGDALTVSLNKMSHTESKSG